MRAPTQGPKKKPTGPQPITEGSRSKNRAYQSPQTKQNKSEPLYTVHCALQLRILFLRFEVLGLILRVLDAFRPRGATWSGQVISSPPGPSGGPSKTHLLPGGGVPRVHRARSPVLPRRPRFATPRSVHHFAAVAAGAYPLRRPPNAWSPGAPASPGPCYWLVASGTPLGWRGGCLA